MGTPDLKNLRLDLEHTRICFEGGEDRQLTILLLDGEEEINRLVLDKDDLLWLLHD